MPSGKTIEERFRVIEHIVLATQNSLHKHEDGFRKDFCTLVTAIVLDHKVRCTCQQRLYGDLRKTAAWPQVKTFLTYAYDGCRAPKCGHSESQHDGPNGECSGTNYNWNQTPHTTNCLCKGPFAPKDFK